MMTDDHSAVSVKFKPLTDWWINAVAPASFLQDVRVSRRLSTTPCIIVSSKYVSDTMHVILSLPEQAVNLHLPSRENFHSPGVPLHILSTCCLHRVYYYRTYYKGSSTNAGGTPCRSCKCLVVLDHVTRYSFWCFIDLL